MTDASVFVRKSGWEDAGDPEEDDDEFEREMNAELADCALQAELEGGLRSANVQYDSDDPEENNDDVDPFYDPDVDDKDQKWVDKVRQSHWPKASSSDGHTKAPNSSAILSCPACFQILSLDCQQHETYHHQFRAMFVMNCNVDLNAKLTFPLSKKEQKKKQFKIRKNPDLDPEETYLPVKCEQCSTQVAVYDQDEVYHFFNVLASQS